MRKGGQEPAAIRKVSLAHLPRRQCDEEVYGCGDDFVRSHRVGVDRLRAPVERKRSPPSADDAKETPITVAWSADSECGTCHATEQASYDDAACVASTHEGQACISCHADASGLATAHEGKTASDTMPKKLKKTEVPDDACLSCHYGAREELVAATVDVAVVDSKGTAVNPHDVTPSEQHDTIRCADCHGMHDAEKLADKADAECASCHHADVFECYTCHD